MYRGASRGHVDEDARGDHRACRAATGTARRWAPGRSNYAAFWAGHDGFVRHSKLQYRTPPFVGDVTFLDGDRREHARRRDVLGVPIVTVELDDDQPGRRRGRVRARRDRAPAVTWSTRTTDPELAQRYFDAGYWVDDGFGEYIHDSPLGDLRPRVPRLVGRAAVAGHRRRRPRDGAPRRRRVPGAWASSRATSSSLQLPNWVETAAAFWGLAMLGAVAVPIVHFYGAKEVEFILLRVGRAGPRHAPIASVGTTTSSMLKTATPNAPALREVVVVGEDDGGHRRFTDLLGASRSTGSGARRRRCARLRRLHVRHDREPEGRGALAALGARRSADQGDRAGVARPTERPNIVGSPVSHATGMLGGLLSPLVWQFPIHFMDVWDPGEVLRAMAEADLAAGSGSPFFLSSLLDHPDLHARAHPADPARRRSAAPPIPAALAERATDLGISIIRGYGSTEHPSTTGALARRAAREAALHRRPPRTPASRCASSTTRAATSPAGDDGEMLSRGPSCSWATPTRC